MDPAAVARPRVDPTPVMTKGSGGVGSDDYGDDKGWDQERAAPTTMAGGSGREDYRLRLWQRGAAPHGSGR